MRLAKKNKIKKENQVMPAPMVEAEVVQQQANERKPQPCVVFRKDIPVPTLEEQKSIADDLIGSVRAYATGYQEDGSINLEVEYSDTFPNKMLKYSSKHGTQEVMEVLENADDKLARCAVSAVKNVIFKSAALKINHTVKVAMMQATKVIVDELGKYSADAYEYAKNAIVNDKYSIQQTPIFPGDIRNDGNGCHCLGNFVANASCNQYNVDAIKRSLSMWIDQYVINKYDEVMQVIMMAVYAASKTDQVEADGIYATIEEFAGDVFKCYSTPIHSSLDGIVGDVVFASAHAYPNAIITNRDAFICSDDF